MPSRMRNSTEQHLRVIDVDCGWYRADKSNQLLAGDNSDTTVPLGQPAWGTQGPGKEAVVTSHLRSPVHLLLPPTSLPVLGHSESCSRPPRAVGVQAGGREVTTVSQGRTAGIQGHSCTLRPRPVLTGNTGANLCSSIHERPEETAAQL